MANRAGVRAGPQLDRPAPPGRYFVLPVCLATIVVLAIPGPAAGGLPRCARLCGPRRGNFASSDEPTSTAFPFRSVSGAWGGESAAGRRKQFRVPPRAGSWLGSSWIAIRGTGSRILVCVVFYWWAWVCRDRPRPLHGDNLDVPFSTPQKTQNPRHASCRCPRNSHNLAVILLVLSSPSGSFHRVFRFALRPRCLAKISFAAAGQSAPHSVHCTPAQFAFCSCRLLVFRSARNLRGPFADRVGGGHGSPVCGHSSMIGGVGDSRDHRHPSRSSQPRATMTCYVIGFRSSCCVLTASATGPRCTRCPVNSFEGGLASLEADEKTRADYSRSMSGVS